MFKPLKSVWNKVSSLWRRPKSGPASPATILHTTENRLLQKGGPVDDIRGHLQQVPVEVPLRRHQLKTAVKHVLDGAINGREDVTPEVRHDLAEKLETRCLEHAGISNMQPLQSMPTAFHDPSPHFRQEPTRQGSVPFNDYPDPFKRPVTPVWYRPHGQGSGNPTPLEHYCPSNSISGDIYVDSHPHEGSSSSNLRRQPRTNGKLRGIARQPNTSESSFSEYGIDPGRIRSTPKSPPPNWNRPLPGDDSPAGYTMIDTHGVRIQRGEDGDSMDDYRDEPEVLAAMYPIPGGFAFTYMAA